MSNPNEPAEKPEPPAPEPGDKVTPPIDKVKSDSEKAIEKLKAEKLEFEKSIKHEKVEFKEFKQEKLEFKEQKQEKFETKEFKFEKQEKSEFEVPGGKIPGGDPGPVERQALLAQAQALEESAKQIRHFIDQAERPDLSDGALKNEDDAPGKQE